MKAAGLNAVSIYIHWYVSFPSFTLKTTVYNAYSYCRGLVNPAPGVFDFDGYRSLQTFYDAASAAGLWVILRPGE